VADAVDADLVVGETSVQGGAIRGPRQGDAVRCKGLAAHVLELRAEVVNDALAARTWQTTGKCCMMAIASDGMMHTSMTDKVTVDSEACTTVVKRLWSRPCWACALLSHPALRIALGDCLTMPGDANTTEQGALHGHALKPLGATGLDCLL
jgi:hypothetical protein